MAGNHSKLYHKVRALFARLRDDSRGMSMILVGFSLVPIAGAVALAYDTSQAYLVKSRLASAVDAAALAGGRVFFDPNRDQDIRDFFAINFPSDYLGTTVDGPFITDNGTDSVTVSASVNLPTTFVRVLGIDNIKVSAQGTVTRQTQPLDVVLAFDVSGSMTTIDAGSAVTRIAAARNAAKTLVEILYGDPASPNMRLGVVPWGGKVNVADFGTNYDDGPIGGGPKFTDTPLAATYDNPYPYESYSFRYKRVISHSKKLNTGVDTVSVSGAWAPNDANVPLDQLISSVESAHSIVGSGKSKREVWTVTEVRKRNVFGRLADGTERWKPSYNRAYFAWNSGVPLMAPPPDGWKGCVYAHYAFTGTAANEFTTSSGQIVGRDDNGDLAEAADDVEGVVNKTAGAARDWMAWMPMGAEGQPGGAAKCDLQIHQHWSASCTPCPDAGTFRLQSDKAGAIAMLEGTDINTNGTNYTNIPQGMVWAWRVLSPTEPFTESFDPNPQFARQQAIILLTDGDNTVQSGDAFNTSLSTKARRDNRLRDVATNIKAAGIDVYAIQFAQGTDSQKALMKEVASQPDEPFYFFAPNDVELNKVFQAVATNLANLRISR